MGKPRDALHEIATTKVTTLQELFAFAERRKDDLDARLHQWRSHFAHEPYEALAKGTTTVTDIVAELEVVRHVLRILDKGIHGDAEPRDLYARYLNYMTGAQEGQKLVHGALSTVDLRLRVYHSFYLKKVMDGLGIKLERA